MSIQLVALQLLNGLALGVLYVLMASGLSVIFGVTNVVNFAHGALYMVGAYLGLAVLNATGNFWLAIVAAPIAVAVFGMVIERVLLNRIYGRGLLYHVIITFGVALTLTSLVEFYWGSDPQLFNTPALLTGPVELGPVYYPKYKLFIIIAGALVTAAVVTLFKYTNFGLIVRGGAQRSKTVEILGIDISKYFTLVFGLGALLAGLAGALAGPFLSVSPEMGNSILIITFIIVILGGLGSFRGSVAAALLIGIVQSLGNAFVPQLSGVLIYLLMIVVLIVRPEGLLGEYEHRLRDAKISYDRMISPVRPTNRWFLGVLGLLALAPLGIDVLYPSYIGWLLALMFIWAIFALSLDLVMGYVGLISFGHAALFGLGAYTVALVSTHVTQQFLVVLVAAVAVSAIVAWGIGALSVRLTGIHFALITLAVAQMLYQIAGQWIDLTGGFTGLQIPPPHLFGIVLSQDLFAFYYVALVLMVGIYVLSVRLLDSPFGLVMNAIRESEERTSFLGYDTNKYKRRTFALSGAIGGCAGALFATYQAFVSPNSLHWIISGDVLIAVVFGGVGTLYGAMLGGAIFIGLQQFLVAYFENWRLVFGVLLIMVVLFVPRGLISIRSVLLERMDDLPISAPARLHPDWDASLEAGELEEKDD